MPNRIVREAILTSDKVDALDAPTEVFYRRLLSKVDDYGRFDGRPSILRTALFPLRVDRVREADCTRWMAACQMAGLIALYSHADKPYLEVLNTEWQKRSPSKYPAPGALQTFANICAQMPAPAHLGVVVDVDVGVDVVVDEGAKASPPKRKPKPKDQTFTDWANSLTEDAIASDDSIYDWARTQGIPCEWIGIAWWVFDGRYAEKTKTYADWRSVFRLAVREDWLKVWRQGRGGEWELTTTGVQAKREMGNV